MGPAAARQRGSGKLGQWLRANPDIADRLQVLEAIADETFAAHEGALGAGTTARERYDNAKAALAWAAKDAEDAGSALSPQRRKDLEANIANARVALDAAQQRSHATNRAQAAARDAVNTATVKANTLAPDTEPRLFKFPARAKDGKVRLVGVGDAADVVAKQLAVLADLKAEVENVRRAPLPKEDIAAQLLAGLTSDSKLRISLNSRKPEIVVPVMTVAAEPSGDTIPTAPDALALLHAIFPDAVETAVLRAVDERYATVSLALDPLAKQDRLERLAAEILAAERLIAEAVLIAFSKGGQVIAPPPGLSAEALLGIE
ncbi:MAG: hypothetical protein BGO81_19295 [Devosia sp. 66-22]|nr:MAG: hypothetical protein BGO81_19295 [Devosia sp. 66-22]